jgi:PAS domain S-box-containing protein
MTSKDNRPEQGAELRRRAEKIARGKAAQSPEDLDTLLSEETRQTLHELRVNQIELEMQNEELRAAQAELDAARARYFDLYDLAPVGYCTISEPGLIQETNLTAATLLGVSRGALIKQPISRFILKEDQDIYYLHRKLLFETGAPQIYELRMVKKDQKVFWAHLAATAARDADGAPVCRVVLSDISLKISHEQLRNLSQHMEKLREEERKRIARELHDELGQSLTALKFDLLLLSDEFGENEKLVERINAINKFISNTIIKSVQELSSKLRPAVLDKIGLKAAIEWLVDDLRRRNNIATEFVANFEELDISQDCSTALFRMTQEALTNVVRHAKASSIKIVLRRQNNHLHLLIKDNGKGIDKSIISDHKSLGLLGMRERAISINGDLKIKSYPGKGTTITVSIPMQKDACA